MRHPCLHYVDNAARILGLDEGDSHVLFSEHWLPRDHTRCDDQLTLAKKTAQALRDIADGGLVEDVSQ